MAAEGETDVHHPAPRCLLGLFDAAVGGLADWSEFDEEAERWDVEVRGLSREELVSAIRRRRMVVFPSPPPPCRCQIQRRLDFRSTFSKDFSAATRGKYRTVW